jgi:hypothetical protein
MGRQQGADPLVDVRRRARRGEADAQYALALAYSSGEGVPRNPAVGLRWLRRAAEQACVDAQSWLGCVLLRGNGAPRDEREGCAWLRKAAARGHSQAREILAMHARERAREQHVRRLARLGESRRLDMAIAEHRLGRVRQRIRAELEPSIRLVARRAGRVRVGASKLGGRPDLPRDVVWPAARRPLSFLAQIDLSSIAVNDRERQLPATGWLWFFYDVEATPSDPTAEWPGWRVLYANTRQRLERCPPRVRGTREFPECRLDAFAERTLPFTRTIEARSMGLTDDEFGRYYDMYCQLRGAYRSPVVDGKIHRMLGHADAIQGDMRRMIVYDLAGADLDRQSLRLDRQASTWRLLLQLDSDDAAEMVWGDFGRIFFWIREADLEARRFDGVQLQLQCG